MNILVLNAGSSSLKFTVLDGDSYEEVCEGVVERIGINEGKIKYVFAGEKQSIKKDIQDHQQALSDVLDILNKNSITDIGSIGHRVVHGGSYFSKPVIINQEVIEKIIECVELAPLHNPANLTVIQETQKIYPDIPHVAVFDTAFHQTISEVNYLYAIPQKYYERYKIRKYGFHGISHEYVSKRVEQIADKKYSRIISCHIGNGASISAIKDGKCVNTSMGFTPVDGLVMGTRAGDIDPGVILFLQEKENLSAGELNDLINKNSGMLGLTGESGDLKDIEDNLNKGNKNYDLAMDIYISRIVRFIGAYIADMGGVDAVIFTAGVLENSSVIRKLIAQRLCFCGLGFDESQNDFRGEERKLSLPYAKVDLFVIPTNEEFMIAKATKNLIA